MDVNKQSIPKIVDKLNELLWPCLAEHGNHVRITTAQIIIEKSPKLLRINTRTELQRVEHSFRRVSLGICQNLTLRFSTSTYIFKLAAAELLQNFSSVAQ